MQNSILIARLLGPALLVIGLATLAQPDRIRRLAREFLEGEALLFLSGLLTLLAGLAIVNTHNRWDAGWPLVITLFGWLMILAGVARLLIPDALKSIGAEMIERTPWLRVPGAIFAVFGVLLSYWGYSGVLSPAQ